MNNIYLKSLLILGLSSTNYSLIAGELGQDQISVDLMQLTRDSNKSVTYLYNNAGSVNNSSDDIALASTGDFNKEDLGYRLSGSKKLSGSWSFNGGILRTVMDSTSSYASALGRLEIIRQSLTNEFDSAHTVQASYKSEMSGEEVNAIYQYSDTVDFIFGVAHLNLDEKFKIISDDTGSSGVGTYSIDTGNDMFGVQAGAAASYKASDNINVYVLGKIGLYTNSSNQKQTITDSSAYGRNNSGSATGSSTVTDVKLGMNYSFSKQVVMNLDYQLINISKVALAEGHFDTTEFGSDVVKNTDDLKWSGFNLGLTYMF